MTQDTTVYIIGVLLLAYLAVRVARLIKRRNGPCCGCGECGSGRKRSCTEKSKRP